MTDSRDGFFRDEHEGLVRFIYMKIGNWEDASDIAQDVFVKYLRNFEETDNSDYHRKWLYSVARNTIIDRWRTGQRDWLEQASSLDGYGNGSEDDGSWGSGAGTQIRDKDPGPLEKLIEADAGIPGLSSESEDHRSPSRRRRLPGTREDRDESARWRALRNLSPRDRDLLLLREDLKWSYPDIMVELEMPSVNAVGRALSRARRRLRELAEAEESSEQDEAPEAEAEAEESSEQDEALEAEAEEEQ